MCWVIESLGNWVNLVFSGLFGLSRLSGAQRTQRLPRQPVLNLQIRRPPKFLDIFRHKDSIKPFSLICPSSIYPP